ncbi:hypothetical protein ACO2Q3_17055 [Caulobacter sp. KR2-114]|uniref:hypothetical protein n=1 Tax=Caulobacter sp. KR2-114 TaxID=3400912 RepID=UPI003C092C2C
MELFIINANIERYQALLQVERDPRQRAVLTGLLQAERDKLHRLERRPAGLESCVSAIRPDGTVADPRQ